MSQPPTCNGTLMDVPDSIVFNIARHFDVKDLNALIRTAKRLHGLLIFELYHLAVQQNRGGEDAQEVLQWAITKRQLGATAKVLEAGAGIITQSQFHTALESACRKGYVEIARNILNGGANISAMYDFFMMHKAAAAGLGEIVQLLLDAGAEPSVMNEDGETALYCATTNNHSAVVQIFLNFGTGISSWDKKTIRHHASRIGYEEVVRVLVDGGADISELDEEGWAPLDIAIQNENKGVVKILLDGGASVTELDEDESTALHKSAEVGNEEIVQLVLDAGADMSAPDEFGWTSLHVAVDEGHEAVAELLLKNGADVTP